MSTEEDVKKLQSRVSLLEQKLSRIDLSIGDICEKNVREAEPLDMVRIIFEIISKLMPAVAKAEKPVFDQVLFKESLEPGFLGRFLVRVEQRPELMELSIYRSMRLCLATGNVDYLKLAMEKGISCLRDEFAEVKSAPPNSFTQECLLEVVRKSKLP